MRWGQRGYARPHGHRNVVRVPAPAEGDEAPLQQAPYTRSPPPKKKHGKRSLNAADHHANVVALRRAVSMRIAPGVYSYLPPTASELVWGWKCRSCKVGEDGLSTRRDANRAAKTHLHIKGTGNAER